jgi:heat shock protein HslJ
VRHLAIILFLSVLFSACDTQKADLSGEWVLKNLFDQNVFLLKKPITLTFEPAERKAAGFAGCNQYFSQFSMTGSNLKFTETGSTKMFCEETMATEMKFLTALEHVQSFKLEGNTLLLLADNKVILEFTRKL